MKIPYEIRIRKPCSTPGGVERFRREVPENETMAQRIGRRRSERLICRVWWRNGEELLVGGFKHVYPSLQWLIMGISGECYYYPQEMREFIGIYRNLNV